MKLRSWIAVVALAALATLVAGCQALSYYGQAIGGHLEVMAQARPLGDWLADPQTPPGLKQRLETARRIRDFASRELGLPDNGSYASYADLKRTYAVWNVFAAGELSVEPKTECFPFAGCVGYRGFYAEGEARRHAAGLRGAGYDVHVGGVPAYSTLGWFDDPLLSTFIDYPDVQLARLVFHELAHQLLYVKDDTTFNESFAVVVEEEGVRRWLEAQGRSGELAAFRAGPARTRAFAARVGETRQRLAALYRGELPREAKLERKRAELVALRADWPTAIREDVNNAYLASVALYTELVPAFEKLLAESGSLDAFYRRAKALASSAEYRRSFGTRVARPGG